MDGQTVETPWGEVRFDEDFSNPRSGRWIKTDPVAVETPIGRAETSFHINAERDAVPDRVRLLMLGGYVNQFGGREKPSGTSTLFVGGATLGWHAQAYLDPIEGGLVPGMPVSVMVVDRDGRRVDSFPSADERVRQVVASTWDGIRSDDPGLAARLYAAMMAPLEDGLDEDVKAAERDLETLKAQRDLARERIEAALERSGASAGPRP